MKLQNFSKIYARPTIAEAKIRLNGMEWNIAIRHKNVLSFLLEIVLGFTLLILFSVVIVVGINEKDHGVQSTVYYTLEDEHRSSSLTVMEHSYSRRVNV